MLLKLFYLILFLSLDVLLYLRLVTKIIKAGLWLTVVASVWLIALVVYLPLFHLVFLMPFKGFLKLSEMILMLLLVHFLTRLIVWGLARFLTDDLKQSLNSIMFGFNTILFAFFFLLHMFIIIAAYHG